MKCVRRQTLVYGSCPLLPWVYGFPGQLTWKIDETPTHGLIPVRLGYRPAWDRCLSAPSRDPLELRCRRLRQTPTRANEQTEVSCLDKLMVAGIVTERDGVYEVAGELTVDTRAVPQLNAHWVAVAHARLAQPLPDDLFSYNVLSVASEDLDTIRELMLATYREIRTIVSNSRVAERVALVNLQLVNWPCRDETG